MIIGRIVIDVHAAEPHEEAFKNTEDGLLANEEHLLNATTNAAIEHTENLLGHGKFYLTSHLEEGDNE